MFVPLAIEFVLVFLAFPIALALLPRRINPVPILVVIASVMLVMLFRDPTFNPACLTHLPRLEHNLLRIVAPIPVMGAMMIGLLYLVAPAEIFKFVRRKPRVWAAVMLIYPVISVIPQTIIYRVYFMHRYEPLFGNGWLMIAVAAAAFGVGHVIFRHPLPVWMTAVGGLLFAWRYSVTQSAPLSVLEHTLYGDLAFTIGYGYYLYHGSVRALEHVKARVGEHV